MIRLGDVAFRREARWLMVLAVAVPAVALLGALVVPALARYFDLR